MEIFRFDSKVVDTLRRECAMTWQQFAEEIGVPEASVMRWRRKKLTLDAVVFLLRFVTRRKRYQKFFGLHGKSAGELRKMLQRACGPDILITRRLPPRRLHDRTR